MMQTNVDPLLDASHRLREAAKSDVDSLHDGLGRLAEVISEQVGSSEQKKAKVGEINSDFQNVPAVERRTEGMRSRLIQIGEQIHQLRADLRRQGEIGPQDTDRLRTKASKIADEVEQIRIEDDKYVLDTVNSNPGAGE